MKRRILSIITALALCLSLCPTWAFAVEGEPDTGLCDHHPEHIGCGYTAPTEGHDCGHRHTAECYTLGVLPDADRGDPYEVGADTENLLDCQHSHDSDCGYVQADPGAPCGYACRICPIEALIAALPEQVTEDNADDVRAQLDHILDLYRELDEGEQEEINLSRIYALQGALDAANDPDMIEGEVSVTYQEASWNGSEVTYTGKTENCTSVESSAEAVTWNAGWYVVNSTVTISEPITVTGAVNLILADDCTLDAQKGIVVTTGNSLTIYAQSGGTGTLNATGTADSSKNASAGIGGSTSSFDSGAITIHGGVINATGGSAGSISYGGAGIGGGTLNYGNGGSSGAITIYGGTVTANSGAGDVTGAGIGGGGGLTGGGTGSNIQIYGGTINATGGEGGAGIGGGSSSGSSSDSSYKSGDGAVTISGGTVTAVGGTNAAGIGGGGGYYYSTQYTSGGCTGGAGSVTISGGIVDAKGGAGNSSGNYAGDPIGNGGNTTAAATVNKTTGIVFENGAGTVCGDVTLDGSYTVPGDYTLNIPAGASLSGSGTLSGGNAFTTENLRADMISVPEDWHYTGEDLTEKIKGAVSLNGEITICGQTFTASTDGWELSVEKVSELEYTVKYTHTDKGTLSKTVTIARGQTALSDVVTYKEDGTTPANTFSVGETIIVKATAAFPANNAIMAAARFDTPAGEQMAVYYDNIQISAPSTVENGVHTMTVDTSNLPESALNKEIALTVKYIESDNASGADTEAKVTVTAVARVEKDGITSYVDKNGLLNAFDIDSGNDGAVITLLEDVELTGNSHILIQTDCTLDFGGHTIHADLTTGVYAVSVIGGKTVTIRGDGGISGINNSQALQISGNVTLEGGTFSCAAGSCVSVVSNRASLSVTSPNVRIENTAGRGLRVALAQSVQLSAGTYSGTTEAITFGTNCSLTLTDLLAEGYAYYNGDTPIALQPDGKELTGTVTVKECNHTGGLVPSENGYQHGGPCKYCGSPLDTANHTLGADNQCSGCGAALAAKVEKSGSDTIYVEASGLEAAFAKNSGNDGATFTLLANVEPNTYLTIQINCILNLGGHTITGHIGSNQCVCVDKNTAVTILGEGEIIAPNGIALAVYGSVTLEGGTYTSTGSEDFSHGVQVSQSATLSVTGEKVTIRNTGGGSGLNVDDAQSVQLSAGTYSGAKAIESIVKLSDMLVHTDNTRYAYYQNDIPVTKASAWVDNNIGDVPLDTPIAWLSDTVTVKACNHAGEGVCTYTHNENTSTHTKTCLACGKTWDAEDCAYTFSGGTGTCAACGDSVTVAVSGTENLIYDGTEKKPGVTVTRAGTELATSNYTVAYTDNTNAGTAKVTVTIGNNQGTYNGSFTIGKATPTITWDTTAQELPYTGNPAAITAPAVKLVNNENFGGTISYSYATQGGTEYKDGLPTNAGTYTIKASIAAQGNYTAADSTNTLTLTINPTPVTLTFANQTIAYGDTPTGATADPASAKIEYSYTTEAGGTPISGWPTNAGTYTVTAKVKATGNYGEAIQTATLTINPKAVSNPTIELSPSSFDYDGTGKEPAVTVKDGTTVIPASEYTVGYSNNINAGTATVTITNVAGNYTVSGTKTFAISAKPLTGAKVEVTGTFTYTGSAQEPTPTVTLDGKTLTANTDYTVAYASNTNAGTAKITVTGMGNYSGTAQGTFTIGRADLTADGTGIASGTYGDKLSELTVSGLTAKLGEATVTGTWKLAGDTVPNVGDSGEYTVTFTPATGADNYNALTAQVTLNIAKATAPTPQTGTLNVQNGHAREYTYDLSRLLPVLASGQSFGGEVTYTLKTVNITEVGYYDSDTAAISGTTLTLPVKAVTSSDEGRIGTITVTISSKNFADVDATINVKRVNKQPVSIEGVTAQNGTYNGSTHNGYTGTPTASPYSGGFTTTYATADGTALSGPPTNAGDYTVTISLNPNDTYTGSRTLSFTVAKASITIKADDKRADVGAAKPALTYTVTGLVSGDTLATAPTLACDADMNTIGQYPITASGAAVPSGGNYNTAITYVPGTLSVTDPTIPVTGVTLNKTSLGLTVGGSERLTATVAPSDATDKSVTWTSSNTAVATVDANGTVTAVSVGTATITVTTADGAKTATCTVTVRTNSSGGGSYVPSGPGSSTITVPVSGDKSTVHVSASVSGTTATVSKIDTSQIENVIGDNGQASMVEIDFTGLGKTIDTVKLPAAAIKYIAAKAQNEEVGGLTVKLPEAEISFDANALSAIQAQAGSQITLTVTPAKPADLNSRQKEAVGSAPVFDLTLRSSSGAITDFRGGYATVSLPYTLAAGQNPSGVVVYYLDSTGNITPCTTMYDVRSKSAIFTTGHLSLYFVGYDPAAVWENLYSDVAEGAWYYNAVRYASENGLMGGYGNGKFGPNDNLSRAQFAQILFNKEGRPVVNYLLRYNDVADGAWYTEAVRWATSQGVVSGYGNGMFGPNDNITREQLAVMLWRYAGSPAATDKELHFTDADKASGYALEALRWAVENGIINGYGDGQLAPQGLATRGQVAQMLMNFLKNR